VQKHSWLILSGSLLLSGCAGGSMGSPGTPTPNASLSTSVLTFGNEVVGTTSQPLIIDVTSSGTAALNISSIATSANFQKIDNCGSTLAAGASCTITVMFTPSATGQLKGTISINNDATGSPQTVSLSGTGVTGTIANTLTGECWGSVQGGAPFECGWAADGVQCSSGQLAITPTTVVGCLPPQSALVDRSKNCAADSAGGESISGNCIVQATNGGGSCSVAGQQCGAAHLPPCCSGFTCVDNSCQP